MKHRKKYDGSKGASFETYAGIRIRGAIVDEMRRGDWAPRSVHRNSRRIAETIKGIEAATGRDAKDYEVAEALDVTLDDYHDMVRDGASTRLYSLDETYEEADDFGISGTESDGLETPSNAVHNKALPI